jgi:CubicO group peptidase (beta-lactamase class C family)
MNGLHPSRTKARGGRRLASRAALIWLVLLAAPPVSSTAPIRAEPDPCAAPADLGDGWTASTPTREGFDAAALCAALRKAAQGTANLHSVLIGRGGHLVGELYRRGSDKSIYDLWAGDVSFGPRDLHDMRSVTKSIVGLLAGIAIAQGKMPDPETPVLDLYPENADLREGGRQKITLEHLLTMSSGLEWREMGAGGIFSNDETRLYWTWTPHRFVLGRPMAHPPGKVFNYSGGGTAVLADILERSTGTPLKDFARDALFTPLGITDWEWLADLHGRPMAFAGLRLRSRDLLKVGRMMLDGGKWDGRQIMPADWISRSLKTRYDAPFGLGYGYQWWTGTLSWRGRDVPWGSALGNGGQRLFVAPGLDLGVVMTGGAYGEPDIMTYTNALFRDIAATVER